MKNKKNIEEIIAKENPEFKAEADSLDTDALNARLNQVTKDAESVDAAKDADEALERARETATELAAPYREAKKALKTKTRYIIHLLKEKGGL